MYRRLRLALFLWIVLTPSLGLGETKGDIYPKGASIKIIVVGASPVAQRTGWGAAFCSDNVMEAVACLTFGRGGRSSKTYRTEGFWQIVLNELRVKGYSDRYVLIEFGHNDKNENPDIGTTIQEFHGNITNYVTAVLNEGGIPVLVSPLATRHFKKHVLADSMGSWADEVRRIARETRTPLVDLNALSGAYFQEIGAAEALKFEVLEATEPERLAADAGTTLPARAPKATPLNKVSADDPRRGYHADYIHLNESAARKIAALVAGGLRTAVPKLEHHVHP